MDCDGAGYLEVARHLARGTGWVTNAYRFLFLPPASFPQPDAHWSPLYPLLSAISFRLFGDTYTAAKLVPFCFGVTVPPLVYLLARAVTGRTEAGWIAGLLAVAHPTLVTWSLRIETEIGTVALVLAVLAASYAVRDRLGAAGLGVLVGLAYLMKYQSAFLWLPVLLVLLFRPDLRNRLPIVGLAGLTFGLTLLPWLVRNTLVFGDPFYGYLRYNGLSYYPEFGGEPRFLTSLTPPPDTFAYLSRHVPSAVAHFRASLKSLLFALWRDHSGSRLLLPLALVGAAALARRWRLWVPLAAYGLCLLAAFSLSVPQPRYLLSLVPLWLLAAGAGAAWLLEAARSRGPLRRAVFGGAVALLVLVASADEARQTAALARDRTSEWNPAAAFCGLEYEAGLPWVRAHLAPAEPVFASEVYHAALLFERPAIQVPFDDSTLVRLRDRYLARTMVISLRELRRRLPRWEAAPPPWAKLVERIPPEEIRAQGHASWYGPVTELRIYRLDAGGEPGGTGS